MIDNGDFHRFCQRVSLDDDNLLSRETQLVSLVEAVGKCGMSGDASPEMRARGRGFRRAAGPYAHDRERRRAKGRRVIAGALDSGDISKRKRARNGEEGRRESTMGNRGHRHIIFSETRPCEWTASQGRAHRGKFFLSRFLFLPPLFYIFPPLQSDRAKLLRFTSMNDWVLSTILSLPLFVSKQACSFFLSHLYTRKISMVSIWRYWLKDFKLRWISESDKSLIKVLI